jgi:hypothetical protein
MSPGVVLYNFEAIAAAEKSRVDGTRKEAKDVTGL